MNWIPTVGHYHCLNTAIETDYGCVTGNIAIIIDRSNKRGNEIRIMVARYNQLKEYFVI